MSEEKKKEIDDFMEVLKNMNQDELTATKFFGLGVVAARESKEQQTTNAHE